MQAGSERLGKGRRVQMHRRVGAPNPPKAKHISEAATQAHGVEVSMGFGGGLADQTAP